MRTEFLRLRRKNALWRILRALMVGLSVALLVAGGLLTVFKLTSTDGRLLLCLIVGGVAGLVVAVVRWLLLHRSDLRAAEQMDEEHNLQERVQTMIAFRQEESAMLELQRQDTEEKLKTVRSYGVRKLSVVTHILALVVAAAVMVTGLVLPARAEVEPPVYVEPDYNASAWQLASLDELVIHVQESNMDAIAKEQTVQELQSLRKMLEGSVTVSVFKNRVVEVIANVYTFTDKVNSNDDVHDVIQSIDYEVAPAIAYVAGQLGNQSLGGDVEDIGVELAREENLQLLGDFVEQLDVQLALIPSVYLSANSYTENDPLYCAALHFAAGLREVAELTAANGEASAVSARLGEVVHTFKSELNLALERQSVTKTECVYVVENLCTIFGLSANECPDDPDPEYSKKQDDEFVDVGGGSGTGEMEYAGDEQIYNYKQNAHISYTEVVEEYYASMIQASLEGSISEEMLEYILKYFSQLYTG